MKGTTAVELHKVFKRHKFTDEEAKLIIDAVDKKTDVDLIKKDINWLKWVIMIGLPVIIAFIMGLAGAAYYLHSDTQAGMRAFKAEMQAEIQALRTEMRSEIKALRTEMKGMKSDIIKEMKLLIKK